MVGAERRGEDEGDVALAQDVTGLVAGLGFQAGVGDHVEAEGVAVEVGRLAGVAHEEADVVDATQGKGVGAFRGGVRGDGGVVELPHLVNHEAKRFFIVFRLIVHGARLSELADKLTAVARNAY